MSYCNQLFYVDVIAHPCLDLHAGLADLVAKQASVQHLTQSKLRLCLANHRAGYFSNLACDWLSIV